MMKMKALALTACIIAGPVQAEVGGTPATAQPIALGTGVNEAWEFAGDRDWYRFRLFAGADYAVGLSADTNGATIRLRKPSRSIVKQTTSSSDFTEGFQVRSNVFGTWYLELAEAGSRAFPSGYQVRIHSDCWHNHTTKCALAVGRSIRSHLVSSSDADAFRVTLDKAKTYTVAVKYSGVDGALHVLRSDGSRLPVEAVESAGALTIAGWRPSYSGTHYLRFGMVDETQEYTLSIATP